MKEKIIRIVQVPILGITITVQGDVIFRNVNATELQVVPDQVKKLLLSNAITSPQFNNLIETWKIGTGFPSFVASRGMTTFHLFAPNGLATAVAIEEEVISRDYTVL